MALLARRSLGIALGARAMQVAELAANGGTYRLVRSAEFRFDEPEALHDPVALGQKLAQFLKRERFSATQTVIGLPAQWLMLKEKTVPPASPDTLADMLLIQAERDFSLEPADLVLDYVAGQPTDAGLTVMLVASLRERIETAKALAAAAGLKLQAITATSLVLATASQNASVLYLGPNGVELATRGADGLPHLRHLAAAAAVGQAFQLAPGQARPVVTLLAGELRRALAAGDESARDITVWDDLGADPALLQGLAAELRVSIHSSGGFPAASVEGVESSHAAAGAALALCGVQPSLAQVDLLRSRLAAKPPPRFSSRTVWSAVAALVLLVAAAWLLADWRQNAAEVDELRQRRDDMKENADAAKSFIARVHATRGWYERRPNYQIGRAHV
jgi:hypothetical protein